MSVEPVGRRLCISFFHIFKLSYVKTAAIGSLGSNGWLWFVLLLFLIIGAGYFAATETAYSTVNKIRIKNLAENGDKRARRVTAILEKMEKALSTLLIGTNVFHISCASIATMVATKLWGVGAVAYSTVVITLIIFMFSEMIPKSYASDNAEKTALAVSGSLAFLMKVLTPFTFVFTKISELFVRIFTEDKKPTVNEDELYDIIETIQEEGSIKENKSDLIYSALQFDDISVSDVLTPRIDVVAVDIGDSVNEILAVVKSVKFSRIPVKDGSVDNMVGVLNTRRFIKNYINYKEKLDIKGVVDAPFYVHKSMPVDVLLKEMSTKKQHMAIVRDEYGGTLGIVTSEDILEELVGDIWDEDDEVKFEIKELTDNSYEVSGDMNVDDVLRRIDFEDYEREEVEYKTMSAWTLEFFDEAIPHEGSSFSYKNLTVTVSEMQHHRITKLIITVCEAEIAPDGEKGAE